MAKNEAKVDSRLLLLPQRVMQMITDPNISFTDDELDLLVAVDVSALFEKSNKELKVCFHVFVIWYNITLSSILLNGFHIYRFCFPIQNGKKKLWKKLKIWREKFLRNPKKPCKNCRLLPSMAAVQSRSNAIFDIQPS
jgi:hypothetical protein